MVERLTEKELHDRGRETHSGEKGHHCPEWDFNYICVDCPEFEPCTCKFEEGLKCRDCGTMMVHIWNWDQGIVRCTECWSKSEGNNSSWCPDLPTGEEK